MSLQVSKDGGALSVSPANELLGSPVLNANAILELRDVEELQELVELRKKGWEDQRLDGHFKQLREIADHADEDLSRFWAKKMTKVMEELDYAGNLVPRMKPQFEFSDIGAAPGGFSFYMLNKNRKATGVGITLPVSMGGYASLVSGAFLRRYKLIEQDILEYDLSPPNSAQLVSSTQQVPQNLRSRFPVVVLDGHALRGYHHRSPPSTPGDFKTTHAAYRDCLLITQLILGLETVRPGGTLVLKLSHIECFPSAHLVYLLDDLSASLVTHKPRTMHAKRGTFYAIARGVCRDGSQHALRRNRYLDGLRALWYQLRCGGSEGRGRMMLPGDLDFIVSADAIFGGYLDRLIELGRDVWWTQVIGLRQLFEVKGLW